MIGVENPRVLVLNGGSSSGKSSLARALQEVLDDVWLRLGVDTLVDAAPPRLLEPGGLEFGADGRVSVGAAFTAVERQWMAGIAAMATAGAHVLVEDNFVSGPVSQQGWLAALHGTTVGWVGVRCAADVAATREAARGDRTAGMAAQQAELVHIGISYDVEVDTGSAGPAVLAHLVREHFWPRAG